MSSQRAPAAGHGPIKSTSFPTRKRAISDCPLVVIKAVAGIDDTHVSDADMDANHDEDDDDNADDVIADDTTTRDDVDTPTKLS